MVGCIAVRHDTVDRLLAEAWVKLSSRRIIMTDDPCKNTMTTALSAKEVNTQQLERSTCSRITQQKQPRKTYQRQGQEALKFRFDWYEMTVRTLCERRRELEQTE